MKRIVLIMGMHRSGTSLLTRMLNCAGMDIGNTHSLIPPRPDNPNGFWEQSSILSLHDELLMDLGFQWDTPVPLPNAWHKDRETLFQTYVNRLSNLVDTIYQDTPVFAVKDPRLCLLLPLWVSLAQRRHLELTCIWIRRPAHQVAQSLSVRHSGSIAQAYALFMNYILSGICAMENLPHAFVNFEDILNTPNAVLSSLENDLHLGLNISDTNDALVDASLVHHGSARADSATISLPKNVERVEALLFNAENAPQGAAHPSAEYRSALNAYREQSELFTDWITELCQKRRALYDARHTIDKLGIENKAQALALEELHLSNSWKLTAPMRNVAAWIRRPKS